MKTRIWVIKVGSHVLMEAGPLLIQAFAQQIAVLKKKYKVEVIWVTSGAIAAARARTGRTEVSLSEKQALSALGQPLLMDMYNQALNSQGLLGAQVLLSYDDIGNRARRANLKATISTLLRWQVVPVLNENDAVSTEEIQFGDNDMLSALVAKLMGAERLLLLTNVNGLYDIDPTRHRAAKVIPHLKRINAKAVKSIDATSISAHGRGGMFSKLKAAQRAHNAGVNIHLLKGDEPFVLVRIANGESLGTLIGTPPMLPKLSKLPKAARTSDLRRKRGKKGS